MVRKRKRKTKNTRQSRGWLNRYDFSYVGVDTIKTGLTTLKKLPPGLTQNTANQVDRVAQKRIVINQGRKEVKRVTSIVIKRSLSKKCTKPRFVC